VPARPSRSRSRYPFRGPPAPPSAHRSRRRRARRASAPVNASASSRTMPSARVLELRAQPPETSIVVSTTVAPPRFVARKPTREDDAVV
jgi:hypothetical protein